MRASPARHCFLCPRGAPSFLRTVLLLAGALVWLFPNRSFPGQKIILHGHQESHFLYRMEQRIEVYPGMRQVQLTLVEPRDFHSLTYRQQIRTFQISPTPTPTRSEEEMDARGNQIHTLIWDQPQQEIRVRAEMEAIVAVHLEELSLPQVAFPYTRLPSRVSVFLQPTALVQSSAPAIQQLSHQLTDRSPNAAAAVEAILLWVVGHLNYVLNPPAYDALFTLENGYGNCQNYAHLAAALCRAAGIPARIINGITADLPYEVNSHGASYQFQMARGRHAWIEVFFPGYGWVPLDPQQSEFFVSSRYLRLEVGLDNGETVNDGLIRWRQAALAEKKQPAVQEVIEVIPRRDDIRLTAVLQPLEVPRMVLSAPLAALLPEEPVQPPSGTSSEPAVPPPPARLDPRKLNFALPAVLGNTVFPEGLNFAHLVRDRAGDNELHKNFLVETAEYVTGPRLFGQAFVLDKPLLLEKIGLALNVFGGKGKLWLELSEDQNGRPGPPAARSRPVPVFAQPQLGYHWVDFDFASQALVLGPGRYWFVLRFDGTPIVNWFFSYGKTVGPVDGTRSSTSESLQWDRIHNFEFVYRVVGKFPEE